MKVLFIAKSSTYQQSNVCVKQRICVGSEFILTEKLRSQKINRKQQILSFAQANRI
jgi:hypothetical protein